MDRLARARKVLQEAEQRAGLRIVRAGNNLAANPAGEVEVDSFALPEYLKNAFPNGLARKGVVGVAGSFVAQLLLASLASKQGAWVAFLGVKDVGWCAAESMGLNLERTVYVPEFGRQGGRAIAAVVDGFDVAVIGETNLSPRERKVVERRALARDCLVICDWSAPKVWCQLVNVGGAEKSSGHISRLDYRISTKWGESCVRYERGGWSASPMARPTASEVVPTLRVVSNG